VTAVAYFSEKTGLSRVRVKKAMKAGAAWLTRRGRGRRRLRRATAELRDNDILELFYNEKILAVIPAPVQLVSDVETYSVWNKPPGLLTQGTDYGDHCSLLRLVEQHFHHRRIVYPVHRLDREASGLVLVAHRKKAAAELSRLFSGRRVFKRYRAEVLGKIGPPGREGKIDIPLDGKVASTRYRVLEFDPGRCVSRLLVQILTGRKHQIRRHLEGIGHPIIGDPGYGKGNKHPGGMKLAATELAFRCPLTGVERQFSIKSNLDSG
jgi:tRNA pseudouridine32 synthase/23S rRNA pseudouridine746 synthase